MGLEGIDMRLRQEITTDTGKAGAKALPQTSLRSVGLKSKTVGNISRRTNEGDLEEPVQGAGERPCEWWAALSPF